MWKSGVGLMRKAFFHGYVVACLPPSSFAYQLLGLSLFLCDFARRQHPYSDYRRPSARQFLDSGSLLQHGMIFASVF